MSANGSVGPIGAPTFAVEKDISLAMSAGTYDVYTATLGDVMVEKVALYVTAAAVGLVSVSIQTDTAQTVAVLGTTLAAVIVLGLNLGTTFDNQKPFLIPLGNKIRVTIVGTGSAGNIRIAVIYRSIGGSQLA